MEPVITVASVPVDPISQLLLMEIEGILPDEHLMHDDSERENIVLVAVVVAEAVVLGGAVGHGEAWVVGWIVEDVLLSSGW